MTARNEKKDVIERALRKLVTETIRRNGFGASAPPVTSLGGKIKAREQLLDATTCICQLFLRACALACLTYLLELAILAMLAFLRCQHHTIGGVCER